MDRERFCLTRKIDSNTVATLSVDGYPDDTTPEGIAAYVRAHHPRAVLVRRTRDGNREDRMTLTVTCPNLVLRILGEMLSE